MKPDKHISNNAGARQIKNKDILFFLLLLFVGAFFTIAYLISFGNKQQVYEDIIYEYTSFANADKSIEMMLMYLLIMGGAILVVLYSICIKKSSSDYTCKESSTFAYKPITLIIILTMLCLLNIILYGKIELFLLLCWGSTLIGFAINRGKMIETSCCYLIAVYTCIAIYRIIIYMANIDLDISEDFILAIAFFLTLIGSYFDKSNEMILKRTILVMQIIVPFLLLVYLGCYYYYEEQIVTIFAPFSVNLYIFILIALFVAAGIKKIRKYWIQSGELDNLLTSGLFISILAFNRYSGSGAVIAKDLHHPYENIIGFSQVFYQGQKLFSEYIPISGLYSLFHGFFFELFGYGKMSNYHVATDCFYLTAIILIVVLLKKHMNSVCVLYISVIYTVGSKELLNFDYNRYTFVLPVMLLLSWPQLIKKKNRWLQLWFLTSFLYGIYYPVYGAATCLGFMPLGIWQICTYIKKGEFRKDIRKKAFWLSWIVCFLPVALCANVLLGLLKHIRIMRGQALLESGLARFGQHFSEDFLPWIASTGVRQILIYLFTFMVIVSVVWISVFLFIRTVQTFNEKNNDKTVKLEKGLPILSIGIVLVVSLSFSFVRLDFNSIYARSAGTVFACAVMLLVFVKHNWSWMQNRTIILLYAIILIAIPAGEGYRYIDENSKLNSYVVVPENYVYVNDENLLLLGEGFISEEHLQSHLSFMNYSSTFNHENSYMGITGQFAGHYLSQLKGDGTIEFMTIKGYEAATEIKELVKSNNTFIGFGLDSLGNYYIYHWLQTSGDYVWNNETYLYEPNDDRYTIEEVQAMNRNSIVAKSSVNVEKTSGAWGGSMDSLQDIFERETVDYSLEQQGETIRVILNDSLCGNDADFLYIEYEDQSDNYQYILYDSKQLYVQKEESILSELYKKDYSPNTYLSISWLDETDGQACGIYCRLEKGKLLIPLGAVKGWLLNEHSELRISIYENDVEIESPAILDLQFLKLREL